MNHVKFLVAGIGAATVLLLAQFVHAAGTITLADSWDIKDWDPAVLYTTEVRKLRNIYETLTVYNKHTGRADPKLATSWRVSNDGLTWTFKLRKDVKFHDGIAFNATVAKANLDRTITMGKGPAYIWESVDSISAPAAYTLVIRTKYPVPIDMVATSQYGAYMMSPAAIKKGTDWLMAGNAVGTGPYKLTQWAKSQQLVMEKFDDYWGGWSGGEFDRVIYRLVVEISTQVQMLRGGEASVVIGTAPPDMLNKLKKDPKLQVSVFDSWINALLSINSKLYPTTNKKFRQALTYIMDYAAIAGDIYGGYGQVPKSCVPQTMWGAGQFDVAKQDLSKATRLLKESGIPRKDWKVTYHAYTGRQEIMQIAEMYQALASQVGVKVELKTGEWGVLWDKQKKLESSANMFGHLFWADWPTPAGWLTPLWHSEDPVILNLSHYNNPEYDRILDAGVVLQGTDRKAAIEKFREAQKIVYDDAVAMCLVDMKKTILHRSEIKGVDYNPAYEFVDVYKLRRD
jgi:peptide/nickel transport system substrate-binding protein